MVLVETPLEERWSWPDPAEDASGDGADVMDAGLHVLNARVQHLDTARHEPRRRAATHAQQAGPRGGTAAQIQNLREQ